MLTKRILSRAAGAWLFGTLIRIASADKAMLDPTLDRGEPTPKARPAPDRSTRPVSNTALALTCGK